MNKILSIRETKENLIEFLYSRNEYMRRVHGDPSYGGEFQTRCPYCGDSQKNYNTGHFYLKIIIGNDHVIPIHCFKCDHSGIFNQETYELMGGHDEELRNGIIYLNKRGKYVKGTTIQDAYQYFERVMPESYRYPKKLEYINKRLGKVFTTADYQEMKVVTSLYDFMIANGIKKSSFSKENRLLLERDYVGFLSAGNSHILFRDITDTHEEMVWIKYPIDEESAKNKVYYGLSTSVDIFTEDEITVNLTEGIMDVLGIHNHIDTRSENVLNYAVTGQNYNSIILHLISIGVVGKNVTLNVYSDNDKVYSDNRNRASTEKMHRRYLEKYKPLFKSVNLFYNLKAKDYGVKKEDIILDKIHI